MLEYVCPKCRTKVTVKEGKRLPSLYCRNCMKTNQLTMLRMIQPRDFKSNMLKDLSEYRLCDPDTDDASEKGYARQ